jgi:hypothetical protein
VNKSVERLFWLLAASGLSERELQESLLWFGRNPEQVIDAILLLRRRLREDSQSLWASEYDRKMPFEGPSPVPKGFSAQVDRLLRREAGLRAETAARLLFEAIMTDADHPLTLAPFRAKKDFAEWVNSLANYVPASKVLHHATAIRNRMVHKGSSDWPLRKRSD